MKVLCAWCHYVIREDDCSGLPDSHGICEKCQDVYYPKPGTRARQRGLKSATPAPTYLGMDLWASREFAGPFSHWPKIDLRMAQGNW